MRLSLLTVLLFINSISFSQQNTINLKSGQHEIEYNFDILNQNEKYYRYVIFSEIPSTEQINQLKDIGINLNIGHLNLASKKFNFDKIKFINEISSFIVAFECSHNFGKNDDHLPLRKNSWYWKILNNISSS